MANFLLTHKLSRGYADSITTSVVIWFRSQWNKRVAAFSGIFTPVLHDTSQFHWAGYLGDLVSAGLIPGLRTRINRPPINDGGFYNLFGDCHDHK